MTVTAEAPVTKYNTGSRNVGGGSVGDSMYRGTFQKLGRGRKSKAVRVRNRGNGYGRKRERRYRKRTREHELVTWLGENEPAENGRFVDCERPNTRYVRDNVAYISYLRSCKRH
ncbi:hypothetical protein K0M31_000978 [Melipona bicolor]|uniref:Uncharacterized protein n=1 Tax=Melipona bicolor TaxID=60889 RepID=A0AA40GEL1_9HYME|nr:hypothetical protein K0M31_000978 [Melipona bicolor]